MKDVGGAVLAGSTPPFLGRERAAVNDDDVDDMMFIAPEFFSSKKKRRHLCHSDGSDRWPREAGSRRACAV